VTDQHTVDPATPPLQESHVHAATLQESGFPARTGASPKAGPARPGPFRRAFAAAVPSLVLVAAGLVAWQWLVTATGVRPQVLPSPLRVAE
jgi:hypothetical protein